MLQPWCGTAAAIAVATAGVCLGTPGTAPAPSASAARTVSVGICAVRGDSRVGRLLAARLSAGITAALRDRSSSVALDVDDPSAGISCQLDADQDFDSASIVKATILAALLCERAEDQESLSAAEQQLATEMITMSDNGAASDLWQDVSPAGMQHFLDLARMTETIPGPGGLWGVTQVTARDQVRLLRLLGTPNRVLDAKARAYELGLMANVEPGQRWGVSAGAPAWMTVHLKNGWLPQPDTGWHINSIGYLSGRQRRYYVAILSDDNSSMDYGVQTVSGVATVINRVLSSAPLPGTWRPATPQRIRVAPPPPAALRPPSRARRASASPRSLAARRTDPVAPFARMGAGGLAILAALLVSGWVIVRRRRLTRAPSQPTN